MTSRRIGRIVLVMKAFLFLALAGLATAGEIEGTVWYDAKGKVAWVEGPAAKKKSPPRFIPHWVAYEQRRDRALRGNLRRHSRGCGAWPTWGGYWHGGAVFRSGTACRPVAAVRGGVRIIVR